jgi:hypothetical protein
VDDVEAGPNIPSPGGFRSDSGLRDQGRGRPRWATSGLPRRQKIGEAFA